MTTLESLNLTGPPQRALHDAARQLCNERFGPRVFVRGVLEISNFCRQNCQYCAMRRGNTQLERYRLGLDELLEAVEHRPAAITDIDIQAGEDLVAVRDIVLPLVRDIRSRTRLGITLCLGNLPRPLYDQLHAAGADFYVLKLETGHPLHYAQIEAPGTYAQRLDALRYLAKTGWSVSSGVIVGLPGQTHEMIANDLELLSRLPLTGCSVSPFIAGTDTPFDGEPNGSLELALNAVALLRQLAPHLLIPAISAMQILAPDGYIRALQAGANLTTINLTPPRHREHYPIYRHARVIMDEQRVLDAIAKAGCTISPVGISESLRHQPATCA